MRRLFLVFALASAPAYAEAPRVVTDIAPVHALAATVMAGVGAPELLLPPGLDPHHVQLRPSQARALARADLVIWMGEPLTPWLGPVLETAAPKAATLELLSREPLPLRIEGKVGTFAAMSEDGRGDPEGSHAGHDHGPLDPHAWLDPINGAAFLHDIASRLSALDPANAALYRANADRAAVRLSEQTEALRQALRPARDILLMPAHDAYAYFFMRFDLRPAGGLTSTDAAPPGAARLAEIRDALDRARRACLFAEAGAPTGLIDAVQPSPGVPVLTFDPVGASIPPGPALYETLIANLAAAVLDCIEQVAAD